MSFTSIGEFEVLDYISVIGFESHVLSVHPTLREWEPWIQIAFTIGDFGTNHRIIKFTNDKDSKNAIIEFENWHLSEKKTIHGPDIIGKLSTGEDVILVMTHQYIDDGAHCLELQFMKGNKNEF